LIRLAIALIFIAAFFFMRGAGDKKTEIPAEIPAPNDAGDTAGGGTGARSESDAGSTNAGPAPGIPKELVSYITAEPQRPKKGDTITIMPVMSTPDVAAPPLSYEWRRNGENLYNNTNTLKIDAGFKRGDKVEASVTYDAAGGNKKEWNVSSVIVNSPPVIGPVTPVVKTGENRFGFKVSATDADGDPLTFSISPQGEGSSVDKSTGEVSFTVPPGSKGPVNLTVNVEDGQGGRDSYNVGLEMVPEKK
jgi:hypothetical protein